ncbi:hypothetical protein BDV29DRAFT_157473 [Aspergillus leporis]|uniref:Uncharacterized protein n=1 Tax=Aspergillus leporis TaxID=41062 RepID=A0A5N5WYG4_9EURO|nr:hypothetical protein BDV29DRAFT_157473 [Aspergillus leporis]
MVHVTGGFYRSLDLLLEMFENAGGSVLAAGHTPPVPDVVEALIEFPVNVLSGGSSQILRILNYIAPSATPEQEDALNIDKMSYASEALGRPQREFIRSVLGPVNVCLVLENSEAGP